MVISDISNLDKKSSVLIQVICDYCSIESSIKYTNYIRNGNKDGLYICKSCKTKNTNLEKYGVENPSQLKEIKEKKKITLINNWGVEHQSKSNIIKEKKKQTNLKNFGVENPFQSDIIKVKIKETTLNKLGVENVSKSETIKEKKKQTTLKNWGVEHPLQSSILLEKVKKTNLEKFGTEWVLNNESFIERIKETNLSNLGVDNPMKSDFIKESIKKKNLEKWGVEHFYQTDEFKNKSKVTHKTKYNSSSYKKSDIFYRKTIIGNDTHFIKYLDNSVSLFKCDKDHIFEIKTDNYFSRKKYNTPLCTICNPIGDSSSIKENELYDYIKQVYDGEIIKSYRDKLEIDIYLPELNIGFEFNGLYWHSEVNKEKNYHLDKTNYFKEKGINIIHIWEDDWDLKSDIIKSQIKNWIGITEVKLYGRKCVVKEITDIKVIKDFLDNNHIQGWVVSKIKLGLYYNDKLVSIMIFDQYEGRKKMEKAGWNLSRFCNKLNHNVLGGASKLLNYFIKNYNPTRIVSYADRTWTSGNMYYKLGFDMVEHTRPDYKYILENKRVHKSRFKKSKLNTDLTEREYMLEQGIYKIYDCGKVKFEKIIKYE